MKVCLSAFAASALVISATAFVPLGYKSHGQFSKVFSTKVKSDGVSTEKPTGTSFLPGDTLERAKAGNPTEKAKLDKDPVNAWVDVYEYARKIREGEMTWEEVEKADLDTVSVRQEENTRCT
jgi:ferredoxin-nitrite reductase